MEKDARKVRRKPRALSIEKARSWEPNTPVKRERVNDLNGGRYVAKKGARTTETKKCSGNGIGDGFKRGAERRFVFDGG